MGLAEIGVNVIASTGNFVKQMREVGYQLKRTGNDIQSLGVSVASLSAPLAALGGFAIKSSIEFNKAMSSVDVMISRTAGNGGKSIGDLRQGVIELSNTTGKSTEEISKGLFRIISTMGNTGETMGQLGVATKAALAGGADLNDTVGLLALVSKNFGDTSAQAQQHIIDLAFVTNELGDTSFAQLAANMDKVTPLAAAMGASVEELFAGYSALSGVTGNTAVVSTQLAGVFNKLLTPGKELEAIFKALGVETGKALIQERGFLGALDAITVVADKNKISMGKVWGEREAIMAVTALTTTQEEKFKTAMEANSQAAGVGAKAYETYTTGVNKTGFELSKLISQLKNTATQLGDELLPVFQDFLTSAVIPAMGYLRELTTWFKNLDPETRKLAIQIVSVTTALAAFWAIAGKTITIIGSIISSKILWGTALAAVKLAVTGLVTAVGLLLTPIGLAITAIATIAGGIYYFRGEIASLIIKLNESIKSVTGWGRSLLDAAKYIPVIGSGLAALDKGAGYLAKVAKESGAAKVNIEAQAKATQGLSDTASKLKSSQDNFFKIGEDSKKSTKEVDGLKKGVEDLNKENKNLKNIDPAGIILDMGDKAKEAGNAVKQLQEKWIDLNNKIKENEIRKSIDEAVKAGSSANLKPLLDKLKEATYNGILQGMDESVKKGGKAALELAKQIAELESSTEVKKIEDDKRKEQLEKDKAAHKESVDFWRGTMEDAITNTRGSWVDQMKKAAVSIGAEFMSSVGDMKKLFEGFGKDLSKSIGDNLGIELGEGMGKALGEAAGTGMMAAISWGADVILKAGAGFGEAILKGQSYGESEFNKDMGGGGNANAARAQVGYWTMGLSELYFGAENFISKGTTDLATLARREFDRQFSGLLDGKNIKIIDQNGVLTEFNELIIGSKDRWNEAGWAETFEQFSGEAFTAFNGVGMALTEMFGISEDIGGQMAALLSEQLGGSLVNLGLLIRGLDIPVADFEAALVKMWQEGKISAQEFSVYLNGVNQGFAAAEAASKDVGLAVQQVFGSGGDGVVAVESFRTLATAAIANGFKDIQSFVTEMVSQGKFTAQQGATFVQAMANAGINSFEQIANASDSQMIQILGAFQSLEKDGGESFFAFADKAVEGIDKIGDKWRDLGDLPPIEAEFKIKVTGDEIPDQLNNGTIKSSSTKGRLTIPALDSGGIVRRPTLALVGERRPEAVIPLEEMPDLMRRAMEGGSGSNTNSTVNYITIDARNAQRGVGQEIDRKLRDFSNSKNGILGNT